MTLYYPSLGRPRRRPPVRVYPCLTCAHVARSETEAIQHAARTRHQEESSK